MFSKFVRILKSPASIGILLSQAVFATCLLATSIGGFEQAELYIYDALTRAIAKQDTVEPRVALVLARESDLTRFGWPLADGTLAELIQKVEAQTPKAIGVDIYRDQPKPPGSAALDEAINTHSNLFWVYKFPDSSGRGLDSTGGGIPAPAAAQERQQVGFADQIIDADGTLRRALLFLSDGNNETGTSLALQLATHALEKDGVCLRSDGTANEFAAFGPCHEPEDKPTPLEALAVITPFNGADGAYVNADDSAYQIIVDYRAGLRAFKNVSVADVIDGKVPADTFKDRVVVIGVGTESVKDFFLTPLAGSATAQPLYGAEVHAHIVGQLMRHALNRVPPIAGISEVQEYTILWVWCVIGTLAGFYLRSPLVFGAGVVTGVAAIGGITVLDLKDYVWLPAASPAAGWLLSAVASTSYVSYREQQDRHAVMGMFARHVSQDVAQELWRQRDSFMNGNVPKSQRLTATVLFSDLKGFTAVSENTEPEALMVWLNNYMEAMTAVIGQHGGVIDKFIGDAIMVVFGVPRQRTTETEYAADAAAAVKCALAMSARLAELNAEWRTAQKPEVGMRIGIHTGPLVAGALGGKERINYTVIGDTVNTASRFESYDKAVVDPKDPDAVSRIIIGDATQKLIKGTFKTTAIGSVTVKGKQEPLTVYLVPLDQTPRS